MTRGRSKLKKEFLFFFIAADDDKFETLSDSDAESIVLRGIAISVLLLAPLGIATMRLLMMQDIDLAQRDDFFLHLVLPFSLPICLIYFAIWRNAPRMNFLIPSLAYGLAGASQLLPSIP